MLGHENMFTGKLFNVVHHVIICTVLRFPKPWAGQICDQVSYMALMYAIVKHLENGVEVFCIRPCWWDNVGYNTALQGVTFPPLEPGSIFPPFQRHTTRMSNKGW
jgi:hypothetical protein